MRLRASTLWALASVASACAGPASPPQRPATTTTSTTAAIERFELSGPATLKLASGATAEIPAGFVARVEGKVVQLLEPDRRVECLLVEVAEADPALAIASAWNTAGIAPGAAEQASEPPASGGWERAREEAYAEDAGHRALMALARQKGARTWVSLLRGQPGDLAKREAQLWSFMTSLKVPGLVEENLSEVAPKEIGARVAELDEFIETAMERSETPGLALAVIEDGKLSYSMGYGVRELGKNQKVDADTLMMIGSVTKSMTTLMMATLVDDQKLSWDKKVVEIDPSFQVGDPELSKQLRVEDLVCACTGMPRKDVPLLLEFEKKQPDDVLRELSTLKPTTKLRETFQYQNHMVAAAGYLAARSLDPKAPLGAAYDRAMKKRVFEPLGMKRTTLDLDVAKKDRNHASPHAQNLTGAHQLVPLEIERFATFVRPSGGVWSSANEMARYVMNELSRGAGAAAGGRRVASEASLTHRWEQQIAIETDVHYGLGFVVSKWKGLRHIHHGGGTAGFITLLSFYPEKGLGVVIVSNGTGGQLIEGAIRAKLGELWFGTDEKAEDVLTAAIEAQRRLIEQLSARTGEPTDAEMAPFAGVHENAELGRLEIKKTKEGWLLDAGAYKTKLLRYTRPDTKTSLMMFQGPLTGEELVPSAEPGASFELSQAQERYVFRRL